MNDYKAELEKFYLTHPDIKLKEEQDKLAQKEKKTQVKEPAGFKPDEKNIKALYFVAYVKKHRD